MEKTKLELFKEIVGNKISDIKQLFDVVTPAPVVASFVDVKTSDGVVLRVDGASPAVGAKCLLVDASGANPAPDAEYTLEDGSTLTVVGGAITEVEAADAEAKEPTDMNTPAKMDEELAKVANDIKSVTIKYAEIEKAFNESVEANKASFAKIEKLEAQNKAMFEIIEQLAEMPTDEPAQTPKHTTGQSFLSEFRSEVKEMRKNRRNN